MNKPPVVLSIAASDNSAGAGIQADNQTILENRGQPVNVVTAITAQNAKGLQAIYPLASSHIQLQIKTILQQYVPLSIKIGVLYNDAIISTVADFLGRQHFKNIVIDTVLKTSAGELLLQKNALKKMEKLFERATVITPNIPEAVHFLGIKINAQNMEQAAKYLSEKYKTSVFLKAGHLENTKILTDILYDRTNQETTVIRHSFVNSPNIRGTGCRLSSALATYLALGCDLQTAAQKSVNYIINYINLKNHEKN